MAENIQPDPNALPTAEDLQGMTPDALAEHREAIQSEADELAGVSPEEITDEQISRMENLADHLDAIDADEVARESAAQERSARHEAARARLTPVEDAAEGEEGDDEPEDTSDEAPVEDAAPEAVDAPAPAPEAVAAGGSRTPARRPAPRKVRTPVNQPSGDVFSIVASADTGFAAGSTLDDMGQVVQAFLERSRAFPVSSTPQRGVFAKHQVATFSRNFDRLTDGLWHGNKDFKTTQDLLRAAADEKRLSGGGLVAAGGWCAPSENLYGLTSMETLDGIIDLPTVGVSRGGINYTPGPDFADIYATAGFSQTEAEAIAGTTKACVEVDCPDFTEVRLDAVGYCVKAPLLTRAAYPEVIQRWLEGTIVANQHKVAARLISAMRTALGTALAPTLTGTPVAWGLLSTLEFLIGNQRQAYRLSESQSLEVKAPRWLKSAVRADFANRNGMVASERVTDQMLADHFADRGANVQWILNYQEIANPLTAVAYPATAEVMFYPAGTFVKGTADVISLDTQYDTADLQTNVYTAAFVEDGVLLAKMQHGGARVTVPVNINGMTGSPQIDDNLFSAQAESVGA